VLEVQHATGLPPILPQAAFLCLLRQADGTSPRRGEDQACAVADDEPVPAVIRKWERVDGVYGLARRYSRSRSWSSRSRPCAMSNGRVDEYAARLERWRDEFAALRTILSSTELAEGFKWRKPCYTHAGKNIVIFQPFNDLCALMFFKGALLSDPKGLLREQGDNSRSSLRLEFRSIGDVTSAEGELRDLVADAILVERAGLRVKRPAPPTHRDYPGELATLMEADATFREAFERLTPGRRRGYLLHFNGAKQSATRAARIERVRDRIMEGFGMHD
jgi:uncharacterized protein YdeI (YjbR/CyaY-like superfamily)